MKNIRSKLSLISILVICMVMLFAVPAEAKSSKYKNLYKKFLSKGFYIVTDTSYRMNSRTGKFEKTTTKTKFKIAKYAVVNLDQKVAPELLVFSKYYSGKKPNNPNSYNFSVAYVKGNKVKIATSSEYSIKIGKKTLKNKSYYEYLSLKENAIHYSSDEKVLMCNSHYYYYDDDTKKIVAEDYKGYYTYKTGKLNYTEGDESRLEKVNFKKITLLKNTGKNRKKSFK